MVGLTSPDSRRPGKPKHKTIAGSGISFREKYAPLLIEEYPPPPEAADAAPPTLEDLTPPRRTLQEIENRWQALDDGKLAIDEIDNEDLQGLVLNANDDNKQKYVNFVKRAFGKTPEARSVAREIVGSVAYHKGDDGPRSLETAQPGLLRNLRKARAFLADRKLQGQAYRQQTGFGIGAVREHTVTLLNDQNEVMVVVPQAAAVELVEREKYGLGLDVLRAAESGADGDQLMAAANAAIDQVYGKKAVGDALVFGDKESRSEAAAQAIQILQAENVPPPQRLAARQSLAMALFAEAMPHKQTLQLLMDMAPVIGQLRSAEAAVESGQAAIAAYESGDHAEFAAQTGLTVLNILGMAGGGVTLTAGAASKAVRATTARHTRRGLERFHEFLDARKMGKEGAARARAQSMARRNFGAQKDGVNEKKLEAFYASLDPALAKSIRSRMINVIGDAGEFYFERLLRRWQPHAVTEADIKRSIRRWEALGRIDEADNARALREQLKMSNKKGNAVADVLVDGFQVRGEGDTLEFIDLTGQGRALPSFLDVKTGGRKDPQRDVYDEAVTPENEATEATHSSFAYIHVTSDEWRHYLNESLKHHLKSLKKKTGFDQKQIDKLRRDIMRAYETVELSEWAKLFGAESALAAALRVRASGENSSPE